MLFSLWGCGVEPLQSSNSLEKKTSSNEIILLTDDEYRQLVLQYAQEYKQLYDQKFGVRQFDIDFKPRHFLVFTDNLDSKIIFIPTYKDLFHHYQNLSFYEKRLKSYQNEYLNENQKIILEKTLKAYQHHIPFYSIQEQQLLLEQIVAHELGHLYYISRHRPSFLPELNFAGTKKFNVGFMRDELYAEFISLVAMKEKYGSDLIFQQFLSKLTKIRLIQGISDAIELSGNYNLYPIYNNINLLNNYSLNKINEIERKVDEMTLQNLIMFGLGVEIKKDNLSFLTEQISKFIKLCQNHQNKNTCYNYVWLSEELLNNYSKPDYENTIKEKLIQFIEQHHIKK